MTKLKAALLGCGAVARDEHLPALEKLEEDVEIVAIADRDEARAQALAAAHSIKAVYRDAAELLEKARPDLVHVLTPPESHRPLAILALQAGAHVLVEKPFAYSVADADAMIAEADKQRRRLTVIHNDLFHPGVIEMRRKIREGAVGEVVSVHFISGRRDQTFIPERWYFETYGGRLGETLPHALYQLVEFFDDLEPRYVDARTLGRSVPPPGIDASQVGFDELRVELVSEGRKAMAHISYSSNFELPTALIVSGTEGSLFVHPFAHATPITAAEPGLRDLVKTLPAWVNFIKKKVDERRGRVSAPPSTHFLQIQELVRAIRSGAPVTVTPAKAREVVRLWEVIVGRYAGSR